MSCAAAAGIIQILCDVLYFQAVHNMNEFMFEKINYFVSLKKSLVLVLPACRQTRLSRAIHIHDHIHMQLHTAACLLFHLFIYAYRKL